MVPAWAEAIEQAALHLAPGGSLHIVDFGTGSALPAPFTRMLHAFLAHYTVKPRAGLEATLQEFAATHGMTLRFEELYRTYTSRAVLTRPL
jgi:S-adenosylmethionine-diacylgycerolhomoserine-N-methlytransferase